MSAPPLFSHLHSFFSLLQLLLFHDPYLALFYLLPPAFVFLAGKNKPQDLLEGPRLVIWACPRTKAPQFDHKPGGAYGCRTLDNHWKSHSRKIISLQLKLVAVNHIRDLLHQFCRRIFRILSKSTFDTEHWTMNTEQAKTWGNPHFCFLCCC